MSLRILRRPLPLVDGEKGKRASLLLIAGTIPGKIPKATQHNTLTHKNLSPLPPVLSPVTFKLLKTKYSRLKLKLSQRLGSFCVRGND